MHLQRVLGAALLVGCTPSPPAASSMPPAAPRAAQGVDAGAATPAPAAVAIPDGLLRYRREQMGELRRPWPLSLALGPWAVRERGVAAPHAVGIVRSPNIGPEPNVACLWLVAAPVGPSALTPRARELHCAAPPLPEVQEVLVRDVDRDGGDEVVVVWRTPIRISATRTRPQAEVYGIDTSLSPTWENHTLVQWQILGSHDPATVDAALASRDRDEPPREDTPPERFLARLATATPAGFRAALDPRGLRRCEGDRTTRCRTTPAAALTDAEIALVQARFFPLQERSGTDPRGFCFASCAPHAGGTRCVASEYTGNVNVVWVIVGTGAARRLSEVRR
jgi:hypothetical protein